MYLAIINKLPRIFLIAFLVMCIISVFKINNVTSSSLYSPSNVPVTFSSRHEDKLKKINDASSANKNLKETLAFLNKIEGFDANRICSSLIRTDVQAKLSRLKSVISTCPGPGFCRLAMRQNGSIYGTSDSRLETIFNLSQVSDKLLIKDPTLLGANYIKFISAGKFLCIDSQNRLIAQATATKECLWYTNSKPITSASNRNVKLVIQKTQKMCKIITLITTRNVDANPHLDLCRNQIKIETAYPTELHRMKSNCIKINKNDDHSNRLQANTVKNNNNKIEKNTASHIISSTKPTSIALLFPISKSNLLSKTPTITNNSVKRLNVDSYPDENKFSKKSSSTYKSKGNRYASLITDLIRQLCTAYLKEELIYKKMNSAEYHYVIRINSQEDEEEEDLAEIPKLCADYLMAKNKTDKFIKELKNELISSKNRENLVNYENKSAEYSYYMNSNENLISKPTSTTSFTHKYKICYALRNKPEYKQCMKNYYRCHQFINDFENLRKCRLKFGVTVPMKFV